MYIGLLNVVIFIEKNTAVMDAVGNHKNSWEEVFYCYATVGGEGSEEDDKGATTDEEETLTFTVRWSSEVAELTTTGYRIRFGASIYDIVAIDHMNYKRKALKIKCRLARRQL